MTSGQVNENAPSAGTERSDRRANVTPQLRARVNAEILCDTVTVVIKHFLTQGSEIIKLYTGYAGYSKHFGVLHHHQLNMIDLYKALVEVIYRRIR